MSSNSRTSESVSPSADEANIWQTESEDANDDDMDYELASDTIVEEETEETDEDEDEEDQDPNEVTLYYDAEEGVLRTGNGAEVRLDSGTQDVTNADGNTEGGNQIPQPQTQTQANPTQRIGITPQQLLRFLQQQYGIQVRGNGRGADDDDDEEGFSHIYGGRRPRPRRTSFHGDRYPPIPSETGRKLMGTGNFGTNDHCQRTACGYQYTDDTLRKRKRLARRVFDREMGIENRGRLRALNGLMTQDMIPRTKADLIVHFPARCFSGQFSEDGSFFFACGQDFKVRMYDTSNPYDWKYYKTVTYPGGSWTITDASLSPDNKLLAYSSIRNQVCLANTEQGDTSDPQYLDFRDTSRRGASLRNHSHFGIWSLRFSGDGSEIVAGTSDDSVYVYDLESRKTILRIPGHDQDVNAVCFGDRMSPHILYSGSDDTTLKVWDRRSLASMRPAGMFLGHTEGLTYIDSKGDGRYVISNGKDQTCKLWDLRKMISTDEGERIYTDRPPAEFDYRYPPYDTENHIPHPNDCSLVTFRGHAVLSTLIRCHFSPAGSTGARYIYTGSQDGKVYIYNLDGTQAGSPIDVLSATRNSRPVESSGYGSYGYSDRSSWDTIVRDCSWHPSAPLIAATSWNGWGHEYGTCTVHTWNDDVDEDELGDVSDPKHADGTTFQAAPSLGASPSGARVTPQLQFHQNFYRTRRPTAEATTGLGRLTSLFARRRAAEQQEEEEVEDDGDEDYVDEDDIE